MRFSRMLFLVLTVILLVGTAFGFEALATSKTAEDFGGSTVLIVHYHRYDGNYDGWNLWVWPHKPQSLEGKSYKFTDKDEFGVFSVVVLQDSHTQLGFIVRLREWEAKDVNADRFVDIPESGVAEIWVLEGEMEYYTDPSEVDLSPRIKAAFLDSFTEIYAYLSTPLDTREWKELLSVSVDGNNVAIKDVRKADPTDISTTKYIKITLENPLKPEDVSKDIKLRVKGYIERAVIARKVLDAEEFYYSGDDLGANYSARRTVFKIWSPVSSKVELLLYDDYDSVEPSKVVEMQKTSEGVWAAAVEGDLHLTAYKYRFYSYSKARETVDIYSRAVTRNSEKSVVIDLHKTNFPGWENEAKPPLLAPEDSIIYEIQVADITADQSTNIVHKGKYLGLTEKGATGPDGVKVGLDHLVELGITHVHIMPIHDIYYIKEGEPDQYGWGYDPYLYWVPEGHYSTNPSDPLSRIVEVKKMVKALHENNIRVILDVVYNHTAQTGPGSPFDQTVPYYFYRTDRAGNYTNGSGVGNEVATERPMMRKYIVDSLLYWVREYHVDGFRFDLLGLFDRETVLEIEKALHQVDLSVLLYGEPWGGFGANITFAKGDQKETHVALFNDGFRDAIRGSVFNKTAKGFALGSRGKETRIKRGVVGSIRYDNRIADFTADPEETINYVSSHDNQTLWDKNLSAMPNASEELLKSAQKLSNAIVLLSQGIPFLHGGSDFCRTKYGNENSYNAGIEINKFDWARKARYLDVFEYYKGLIELRKKHIAFRMRTAEGIRSNLTFINTPQKRMVAFVLNGKELGDTWNKILVVFNANTSPVYFRLPDGEWELVADEKVAGTATIKTAKGIVRLSGTSAYVFHSK